MCIYIYTYLRVPYIIRNIHINIKYIYSDAYSTHDYMHAGLV